jgi:hypothetical protein
MGCGGPKFQKESSAIYGHTDPASGCMGSFDFLYMQQQ